MATQKGHSWLLQFSKGLQKSIKELPSPEERQEILSMISSVIEALEDLRRRMQSIPDDPDRSRILDALGTLESFVENVKSRPHLAVALGLYAPGKSSRAVSPRPSGWDPSDANLLKEFESLSIDEIQNRLLDYRKVSVPQLKSLARQFGISGERLSRAELVDRIVKLGFANKRGYEALRGNQTEHETTSRV